MNSLVTSANGKANSDELCEFRMECKDLIPIFPGTTGIHGEHVRLKMQIPAGQAIFSKVRFYAKTDGLIEVTAVPGSIAFMTNKEEGNATVQIIKEGSAETILLKAGQIVQVVY
jgi:hypothetical protein